MLNTRITPNHKSAAKSNSSDPLAEEFARYTEAWLEKHGFVGHLVLTGADARRYKAMVDDAREHRQRVAGGSVYRRRGTRFLWIKFRDREAKWRYESTGVTDKAEAHRILAFRAYESSNGLLPGTARVEQLLEHLLDAAKVEGQKSIARKARAVKALLVKFEGCRAEQVDRAALTKYAADREAQGMSRSTVYFELSMLHRAYTLARDSGVVKSIPVFPRISNLPVRKGFIEPDAWPAVRRRLRVEFRDAAEFAFLTGARLMETLSLRWSDVEMADCVIHVRETKNGHDRAFPYASYPQLAALIERRARVAQALKRAQVISPWVFCFEAPVRARSKNRRLDHRAGEPLFQERASGERGLLKVLHHEWRNACRAGGHPALRFHDLRRSAARDMERAGIPRSVAMKIGGWTGAMYNRYAIGAESETALGMERLGEYLQELQSGDISGKSLASSGGFDGGGGGTRTHDSADMSRML